MVSCVDRLEAAGKNALTVNICFVSLKTSSGYPMNLMPELAFLDPVRSEHPLDVMERFACHHHWTFDRAARDELSVTVSGKWTEYHIAFTWISDVEALHVACAFDLKMPERRRNELAQLMTLANEQMWVGHFDLWSAENAVMFRHALLLSGGAEPTDGQCEMLLKAAVDACERYYQAFQFVIWAGRPAREALDAVLFETEGEA
jgi:hypothetical protein